MSQAEAALRWDKHELKGISTDYGLRVKGVNPWNYQPQPALTPQQPDHPPPWRQQQAEQSETPTDALRETRQAMAWAGQPQVDNIAVDQMRATTEAPVNSSFYMWNFAMSPQFLTCHFPCIVFVRRDTKTAGRRTACGGRTSTCKRSAFKILNLVHSIIRNYIPNFWVIVIFQFCVD